MIDFSSLGRHENVALSFSGGKDSLACVYLLRERLSAITIYHMDTGDMFPEAVEVVNHVRQFAPRFVTVQGDVLAWQRDNGFPTDLLPFGSHPLGRMVGHEGVRLSSRYDCCAQNLMIPLFKRMIADGNTLLIRGTKRADPLNLPMSNGDIGDGIELWLPIQEWSAGDVFDYLRSVDAPISRNYEHAVNSPDCMRCSAWWGTGRLDYLKAFHPDAFAEARRRMQIVSASLMPSLTALSRDMGTVG